MKFPEVAYLSWAKSLPPVEVDLARSAAEGCPASLLDFQVTDFMTTLHASDTCDPLRDAIAYRYGVQTSEVFPLSGGASYANWIACAAILDGCERSAEVIVERPTYEPLLRVPQALGHRIRRLRRDPENDYAIDLDKLESFVRPKTRLAIVSNLHNPSGMRIDPKTLREMAEILARVHAYLLVDEIYLECMFRDEAASCMHAGSNVVATNSLTKAYGLDGLRAGWILGPSTLIERAARVNDLMTNNNVAPGEQMTLAALRQLHRIGHRAHETLDPNLEHIRTFLALEHRLKAAVPDGGTIVFARLPPGIDDDRFTAHLVDRYSTLVVPGRFFESPGYVRIGFGGNSGLLSRGLANISRALDDLSPGAQRG